MVYIGCSRLTLWIFARGQKARFRKMRGSGAAEELRDAAGIDAAHIVAAIRKLAH